MKFIYIYIYGAYLQCLISYLLRINLISYILPESSV